LTEIYGESLYEAARRQLYLKGESESEGPFESESEGPIESESNGPIELPNCVPRSMVRIILKQVLQALQYLHDECFLIHTDIKQTNLLFRLTDPVNSINEQRVSFPARTYPKFTAKSLRIDPEILVMSQPLTLEKMEEMSPPEVVLVDFGSAVRIDHEMDSGAHPLSIRSPEKVLRLDWSTGVDIWSIGCLAVELLAEDDAFHFTFETHQSETGPEIALLGQILDQVGYDCFPPSMITEASDLLDSDGKVPKFRPEIFEYRKKWRESLEDDEFDFVKRCFTLNPSLRPSARDLLEHPWIKGLG